MNKKFLITTALLTVIATPPAFSDQVITDDLIVVGNTCVGFDCTNNMVFGTEVLRLQENNTRILFIDNTAGDVLGQTWMMIANGSNNGGNNKFQFEARSLTKDAVLLSDGTYPALDCSLATGPPAPFPYVECLTTGFIPAGEPVLVQDLAPNYTNTVTVPWFTVSSGLYLGYAADSNVSIGADSENVTGAVSIGKSGLKRKLMHVAKALAATDLATVADIDELTDKLDAIDRQLNAIESAVNAIDGSPLFSSNGSLAPVGLLALAAVFLLRLTRQSPKGARQ
jgi:hypothetical protein